MNPAFVKVGKVGDFPEGRGRAVRVDGVPVAVFRLGPRWFAVRDGCPHMGASLADGRLQASRVVCHRHGWKIDLESGKTDRRPEAGVDRFPVEVRGDDVYLGVPDDPAPARAAHTEDDWIPWDPDRFFKKR